MRGTVTVETAAPSLGMDVRPVNVRIPKEIERAVTAVARRE